MKDLIERQVAIDAVKKNTFRLTFAEEQNCEGHVAWSAEAVYSDVMEGALLDLPSAQPEIIRCKDCRHRIVNDHYGEKGYLNIKGYCELDTGDPFELGRDAQNDDWFCADAERRDDG